MHKIAVIRYNTCMLGFLRKFVVLTVVFILGMAAGGFVVTKIQPRAFLNISECATNCLNSQEFLGLLGSIAVQYTPDSIPDKILETEKTVVIKYPKPVDPIHYVIIPKKDIKNISEVADGDQEYIMDSIAVISEIVGREKITKYKVTTNGPGYQDVAYLHFHLTGRK